MSEVSDAATKRNRRRTNSNSLSNESKPPENHEKDAISEPNYNPNELFDWEKQFRLSEKLILSNPDIRYPAERIKVLIINHFKFDELNTVLANSDVSLDNRKGSEEDIKELEELFKPESKYDVMVLREDENDKTLKLTKKKVFDETKKVLDEEMDKFDQLFIIISSHGNIEALAAFDTTYNISDFLDILKHKNLEGKPKFIILNACRVEEFDKKTKNTKRIDDHYFCELDTEDCLLVYSAYPGKVAYRHTEKGGRLLRSFRIALRELRARNEERLVLDLFNDIKRHVSTMTNVDSTQMPIVTNNLTKRLYI